ncbi:photosynthetic complex assembly protein PuhC [Phaeobacter sp.]|uniref:photosynthetic complex assembly protein PuhC n=1 Tax=Phaeobacter sp. TaxID=1902409 RepID=UPI0026015B62|nr:photosynthetic complex assembly protein PuhC [Phaeobacter sp.]
MRLIIDAETEAATRRESKELIPKRLLQAMAGLVLFVLALVTFAVVTERPKLGQPKAAELLQSRDIILQGEGNAVQITDPTGTMIVTSDNGGFIAAVRSGLMFERHRNGIVGNPAVELRQYENKRLQLHDPATGWEIELTMFGSESTARWLGVLDG